MYIVILRRGKKGFEKSFEPEFIMAYKSFVLVVSLCCTSLFLFQNKNGFMQKKKELWL